MVLAALAFQLIRFKRVRYKVEEFNVMKLPSKGDHTGDSNLRALIESALVNQGSALRLHYGA